jgi:excisionase family DNA binding protein
MSTHYHSLNAAAEYFDVTPRTLRNWASAGLITLYRLPAGRTLRVRLDEIETALRVVPTVQR